MSPTLMGRQEIVLRREISLRHGLHEGPRHVSTPARLTAGPGEVREVSLLMADLRGFTIFCERVTPAQMAVVLNEYLDAMVRIIIDAHGRVQDVYGDGVLGVFGAPGSDPHHAWHAVLSALTMQASIGALVQRWEGQVGHRFDLGVAIHTGEVYAGRVGPSCLRKYAVAGDAVNTVARLEELNRQLGTGLVMSGETRSRVARRVAALARGSFTLRGRLHPVDVFEVLGIP